jgi:hypothetical protein
MQIELLQQASSTSIHSGLFSEKIPMKHKSGEPSSLDIVIGHKSSLMITLDKASTE